MGPPPFGPTPSGPAPFGPPPFGPPPGEWADALRTRLFDHRTILVRGTLDDGVANQAAAELMTLDATGDSRITMHLDLSGGTLEAAFALMDVIDLVGVPVHALCVGRAEGAAVGVLAVATRRAGARHATFRLRDPTADVAGPASELARWAEHHRGQVQRFHERLAAAVHRPVARVATDCEAGAFLTAEQALAYGLIDEVATARGAVYPLPGRRVGFRPDDQP